MPSYYIEDSFASILNKLVKSGYGDALTLLKTPTDIVIGHLHYENFTAEFKNQLFELLSEK